MLRLSALFAVALCALCTSAQAEIVDNPQYDLWKDSAVGTSVTFVIKAEAMGMASEITNTASLVSKDADKLVVENKMKQSVMGQSMEMPAQKTDVPSKVDNSSKDYIDPNSSIGEEEVTVPAGTFKCKIYEKTHEEGGNKSKVKAWVSKDVPGGMVKMEMSTEGQVKSSGTGELQKIERK